MELPNEKIKRTQYHINQRRFAIGLIFLLSGFGAMAAINKFMVYSTTVFDQLMMLGVVLCSVTTLTGGLTHITECIETDTHTIKNGQPLLAEEDVQSIK